MSEQTKNEPIVEVLKVEPKEYGTLTTKKLKKMTISELIDIANQMATRLQWLHSTGKENDENYIRLAGELYHVADIIELKQTQKKQKPKVNYGK